MDPALKDMFTYTQQFITNYYCKGRVTFHIHVAKCRTTALLYSVLPIKKSPTMKEQIITSFTSEGTFATQQRTLSFHGTMAFQSGAHQVHDKHLSVLFNINAVLTQKQEILYYCKPKIQAKLGPVNKIN